MNVDPWNHERKVVADRRVQVRKRFLDGSRGGIEGITNSDTYRERSTLA